MASNGVRSSQAISIIRSNCLSENCAFIEGKFEVLMSSHKDKAKNGDSKMKKFRGLLELHCFENCFHFKHKISFVYRRCIDKGFQHNPSLVVGVFDGKV